MEDLWKITRIDYRISAIAEQGAYEEIVRRYHHEEAGDERPAASQKASHRQVLTKE